MMWQLIAHHDAEVRSLIERTLHRALEATGAVPQAVEAGDIARSYRVLESFGYADCNLLIIGSSIPADESTSVGMSGREPTKTLIKRLKLISASLPVIVVANTPDDRLADFLDAFQRTALVTVGVGLPAALAEAIGKLFNANRARGGAKLKLDIQICDSSVATWGLRRVGGSGDFVTTGTLPIDASRLKRVIAESDRLGRDIERRDNDWLASLGHLSQDLHDLLFAGGDNNTDCWARFVKHRDQVGGPPNTWVCVTVNDQTHPMLVEALKDRTEAKADGYWMLQAPLFRRYQQDTRYPPLFKDRISRIGDVHCLIVEADPEPGIVDDAPGGKAKFLRLAHSSEECSAIAATLQQAERCHVEHLRIAELGDDVVARLTAMLKRRHWHIVHFCGHLSGSTRTDAGLVLRAADGGILPVEKLSGLLRTQLLFLSGCSSGSTAIVASAVEKLVPALLGFHWSIDDGGASVFARTFYRLLFDSREDCYRYLEYAFMKARQEVYRQHPLDPSWAAPIMVMQMA